jgi:hypothetical protein
MKTESGERLHNKTNIEGLVTVWLGAEMKEDVIRQCKIYGCSVSAAARMLFTRWLAAQQRARISKAEKG